MERAVEKEWTQEIWRGSPVELAELISETVQLAAKSSGEGDPGTRITITKDGDDLTFRSVAEFSEFARGGDSRLREARRLQAWIGRHGAVHVSLGLRRSFFSGMPAVSTTVSGADPVAVNGVAAEIRRLARRNGWWLRVSIATYALWVAGIVMMVPSWFSDSKLSDWMAYAGLVLVVVALCSWFLHPVLVPHFEVIDPNAPESGIARVRRWLVGSGRWLLAAVAGAVVYAVAQKLIAG